MYGVIQGQHRRPAWPTTISIETLCGWLSIDLSHKNQRDALEPLSMVGPAPHEASKGTILILELASSKLEEPYQAGKM